MVKKIHYHSIGNKRRGRCDGKTYQRFGPDIMRKEGAIGIAFDIIGELCMEGVETILVSNYKIALDKFIANAKDGRYGEHEKQLFCGLEHWDLVGETDGN